MQCAHWIHLHETHTFEKRSGLEYFDPQFFKKGLEILTHNPNAAVVTSHLKMFGENTAVSKPRGGDQYNFLFSSECPACAMVRKSCWDAVGGYDEAMTLGYEDWEFYIRITQKGWTVAVIPEILFYYRQTQKSTHRNSTIPNREKIIQYIVEKHAAWYLSAVYRFRPQCEAGIRFDRLQAKALHEEGFEPARMDERSVSLTWKPDHMSALRLQWTGQVDRGGFAEASEIKPGRAVHLQFVRSFGAHGAHSY